VPHDWRHILIYLRPSKTTTPVVVVQSGTQLCDRRNWGNVGKGQIMIAVVKKVPARNVMVAHAQAFFPRLLNPQATINFLLCHNSKHLTFRSVCKQPVASARSCPVVPLVANRPLRPARHAPLPRGFLSVSCRQ